MARSCTRPKRCPMQFNDVDRSQIWFKRLQDSLEERLQKLREQNDRRMDLEDTAQLRGQIHELKHMLAAMSETPTIIKPQRRQPY